MIRAGLGVKLQPEKLTGLDPDQPTLQCFHPPTDKIEPGNTDQTSGSSSPPSGSPTPSRWRPATLASPTSSSSLGTS